MEWDEDGSNVRPGPNVSHYDAGINRCGAHLLKMLLENQELIRTANAAAGRHAYYRPWCQYTPDHGHTQEVLLNA